MQATIIFLVVISILVMIHELGHFLAARMFGVGVKSFAIGFPPTLWSKQYGETIYKINAIPLGGYVSLVGETEPEGEELNALGQPWRADQSLESKSWYQKLIILVAGIVMNFLLALIIFIILGFYYKGFYLGFFAGLSTYQNVIVQVCEGMGMFLKSLFGHADVSAVSGPVGIAQILKTAAGQGFDRVLFMAGVLSINLGVLNLIPFPALDGGQMLIVLIERVIKRKLPIIFVNIISIVGFSALMLLSLIVSVQDVRKIL